MEQAADPVPLPGDAGWIVDTQGFGLQHYCGVFLLWDGHEAAIVETGPSVTADRIFGALKALGIPREKVRHVLATHIHLDHAGAAWRILEECPNATFYVHEVGLPYLTDAEKAAKLLRSVRRAVGEHRAPYFGTIEPIPLGRAVGVPAAGMELTAAGHELHLIHAPGHAPHHYVVHDRTADGVFTGDVLGIRMPNRPVLVTTPPPNFELDQWLQTIDALAKIDARWAFLTHFGWQPYRHQLQQHRSLLAGWVDEVDLLRSKHATPEAAAEQVLKDHPELLESYGDVEGPAEALTNVSGVWLWFDRRG